MFGVHVNKSSGTKVRNMEDAIKEEMKRLYDYGVKLPAAQIFVTGPRNYKETLDIKTKNKIFELGFPLIIHGAYVDKPWSGAEVAVANVIRELKIAKVIGASGVVVHLSKSASTDDFIPALSKIYNSVENCPIIWLETHTAKPAPHTYETPEKIEALFKRIPKNINVGLCIDSAHLFACGMALDTRKKAKEWFDKVSKLNIPLLMHLNDSASKLASGVDKHAPICHGHIWKDYHPVTGDLNFADSGLSYIIEFCSRNHVPMIFERHNDDVCKDLKVLAAAGIIAAD